MKVENSNFTNEEQRKQFPNYFYAGFWSRFFAFFIDYLCINILTSATIGLVYKLIGLKADSSIITIYGFFSLVIYLGYFVLLTKLNDGQTIGKMIFGLKVVSFQEDALSWQTVLIRELFCRFILKNIFFSIGYLITIFTPKKQHIGDYFSNTSVVKLNFLNCYKYKFINQN
ncbi:MULTISPECIES: RDD family protein [Enterococcus]|uniref:RDD family protein n=1 Tax=Enterococcus TaxID=1350 RepID=UPI0003527515|nr:RDD family protein [Enterococcus faecalis]EPH79675.1 RDD family protein [Enterococcus faecalis 02-MB-BW-10]EPH82664.1 RDD family protein [Enterococcus faecalis 06-MB-S-10]EPH88686.1 RDD family protein [Enterococcus faecalis F01966]EPH91613.1 RDD family protein [Enterococcus faecalis 06-MB-S-04]EPI33522.1 RDD family protein [Enterococcus faecalis VC1B-1]